MPSAQMTTKGQITIPKAMRETLGLKPGDRIDFYEINSGEFVLVPRNRSIMELRGCLAGIDLPKSDEEMNELIHRRAGELDEATKSSARKISDGEAA